MKGLQKKMSSADNIAAISTSTEFKRTLALEIIRAEHLAPKDSNGLSDPYVKVTVGKTKLRTKVKNKTLNPEWRHPFVVEIKNPLDELKIAVWDYDQLRRDDFEGQIIIPLSSIGEGGFMDVWKELQGRGRDPEEDKTIKGKIQFSAFWKG